MLVHFLAVVVSGLLLALALPKFNLTVLLWGALLPLLWVLDGVRGRRAFVWGLLHGLAQNLVMFYWIVYVTVVYGKLPWPVGIAVLLLLAGYLSLYRGAWAWLYTWGRSRRLAGIWWGPVLWVSLEFLQTYLLTGFPWMLLGYGFHQSTYLLQSVDLTGVYGLSALIVLWHIGLYAVLAGRAGRRRWQPAVVALLALLAVLSYGWLRLPAVQQQMAHSPTLAVAVVQGNIEQGRKWDPAYQQETIKIYRELTLSSRSQEPRLVVWPETAAPFFFLRDQKLTPLVTAVAQESGSYLLFGSPAFESGPDGESFFNRAYLLDQDGAIVGYYDKAHLVPYGEYVPLRRFFPFIGKMVPMVGDFVEGPVGRVLNLPEADLGILICFESIFPYLSRAMVHNGANLLVNITNDAWFGRTSAPYQHLAMSVTRAVENRVSLARAANTGISALVRPDGSILWQSDLYTPAAHTGPLPLLGGGSFYTHYGDLFAWLCVGLAVLGLAGGAASRRPNLAGKP
ncbi:MAG: apolipoprotein N-acyltransferase [Desulfobacca sp.]|uniref:apolipoprotein N-acyltransferase n=1 Tax=Desulfobacca sp. TaxID=2067990 RepID=UPI00404A9649